MRSKRQLLADFCLATGLSRFLAVLPRRPILLVLNYHRIGKPEDCPFDRDVISATPEAFDEQIRYLRDSVHVAGPDEVEAIVDRPDRLKHMTVALTFDDGYLDNYEFAFPILQSHGISGFFFLPTAYIETNRIPWWDQMAFMVRNAKNQNLRMSYPFPTEYHIRRDGPDSVIREILRHFAAPDVQDPERFISELEEACHVDRPYYSKESLFLDWSHANMMSKAGMGIGSHTHQHNILARMPESGQRTELKVSREVLEGRIGKPVWTLAYPVGTPTSFTSGTTSLLAEAGYKAAFSYYGGINTKKHFSPFDIRRIPVETDIPRSLFILRILSAAVAGREII